MSGIEQWLPVRQDIFQRRVHLFFSHCAAIVVAVQCSFIVTLKHCALVCERDW